MSLYLQSKKISVIAIDNSPLAIEICKKRGVKEATVLSLENIDKIKEKNFTTVAMMGNNFGLLGGQKKAKKILKDIYKITTEDALIIAEATDPYKTKEKNHLDYHKENKKKGKMPGQLRMRVRFKKYIGPWFDYLFLSKKEMRGILIDTGWEIDCFIDSDKPSYIAVIKKKNSN